MALRSLCRTLLLAYLCPYVISGQNKYEKKIKECYAVDKANFNNCFKEVMQEVMSLLKVGIPELNLPVMDPFFTDTIDFVQQGRALQVTATLKNVNTVGASSSEIESWTVDKPSRVISALIKIPHLNTSGEYVIDGTIMLLPLKGAGRITLNMSGVESLIKLTVVPRGKGVGISKVDMDLKVKNFFMKLDNKNKEDTLEDAINKLLSDNSQHIFDDIKPALTTKLADGIGNVTEKLYQYLPPDIVI